MSNFCICHRIAVVFYSVDEIFLIHSLRKELVGELSVESPAFVAYSHSFDDLWDIAVPVKEDLWVS